MILTSKSRDLSCNVLLFNIDMYSFQMVMHPHVCNRSTGKPASENFTLYKQVRQADQTRYPMTVVASLGAVPAMPHSPALEML